MKAYNDTSADKYLVASYKDIKNSSDRGEIHITLHDEASQSNQFIFSSFVQDKEIIGPLYFERFTLTNIAAKHILKLGLNDVIASRIGQIPEVEKIFLIEENGVKKIFTIINRNEFRVKKLVYEGEGYIIDNFVNERCDFHIIWREDRDLNSIIRFTENPIYDNN